MFESIAIVYLIVKGAFFAGLVKAFTFAPSTKKAIAFGILYTLGVGGLSFVYFNPEMLQLMGITWDTRQKWLTWTFCLSTLYFWLLARFDDAGFLWWLILASGVGLVIL